MRFEPPRPRNDEERILPLINVVFLLLIFFMLAGRIAASDPFQVAPPRSETQAATEAGDMLVLVAADGRLALDGKLIEQDALQSTVAARLAENDAAAVRLKADGGTEAVTVVALMEALREAGLERLELLTVPEHR